MIYDIVIVGGGPAGLTAAIYGLRAGKNVLVIADQNKEYTQILFKNLCEKIG